MGGMCECAHGVVSGGGGGCTTSNDVAMEALKYFYILRIDLLGSYEDENDYFALVANRNCFQLSIRLFFLIKNASLGSNFHGVYRPVYSVGQLHPTTQQDLSALLFTIGKTK